MNKNKIIECTLYYDGLFADTDFGNDDLEMRWTGFKIIAPALCKDLRPGQSRKLVLTQTARGIKLEGAEP